MSEPKNVLFLGETGVGKSTTGNRLTGKTNFSISGGVDPETKEVTSAPGVLPTGGQVNIIDTPGQNDGGGDEEHVRRIIGFCRTKIQSIHAMVIVLNGSNPRISDVTARIIKMYCFVFGRGMAKHVAVVLTRARFIKDAVAQKNQTSQHVRDIIRLTGQAVGDGDVPVFAIDNSARDSRPDDFAALQQWIGQCTGLPTKELRDADPRYERTERKTETIRVSSNTTPIIEQHSRKISVPYAKEVWDGRMGKIFGNKKTVTGQRDEVIHEPVEVGKKTVTTFRSVETVRGMRWNTATWEVVSTTTLREWTEESSKMN